MLPLFLAPILAVASGCGGSSEPGGGPLDGGAAARFSTAVEVGDEVSMSHARLSNDGDEPAVIERVRLLGVTGPFEFLGVLGVRLPDDGKMFIGGDKTGFPPTIRKARPLSENPVPVLDEKGTKALQLVIGVRVTSPGVARSSGAEVTYRIGDKQYRETFEDEVYLCAPLAEYIPGDGTVNCPPDEIRGSFEDRTLEWSAAGGVER